MKEPQKPHRMTHRNAVTGEIISVTEYPENAPILPALTANERGADRGWPDAEIAEIARRMRRFADGADACGNPISAEQDRATASMLDVWIAERAQHAAEIAAAVQAEREACAKVCADVEEHHRQVIARKPEECTPTRSSWQNMARSLKDAIRARGTTDAVERVEAGVRG